MKRPRISVYDRRDEDIEFQSFIPVDQLEYPTWYSKKLLFRCLVYLHEDTLWNCYMCCIALVAIVLVFVNFENFYADAADLTYNISYALHVFGVSYKLLVIVDTRNYKGAASILIDLATFVHYFRPSGPQNYLKLACYYIRMHRPLRFLWQLNDYNLKGSVLGTTLKYCYICLILRITWVLIWVHFDKYEAVFTKGQHHRLPHDPESPQMNLDQDFSSGAAQFLRAFYTINKMFIPIGPSLAPVDDMERIACLLVMLSGCLVVTGAAIASLSLVISIYMRPAEAFHSKYRLIMQEMKESNMPPSLREKVETFYKMYWHKQRGVSATQLLPTYPPTVHTTIYTDIYFGATQKSRVLCNLSYPFLSELAKKMHTIHYIPGDPIIRRSTRKSTFNYIAYGDIEMLSAEDDSTPILRMTCGTALAACAGGAAAACARAPVQLRAATFCTTHALHARDLWRVAAKYGRDDQPQLILAAFSEHLERVKKHYAMKKPEDAIHKSSILRFKRNLMALKEARDASGNLLMPRNDVFLKIANSYIKRNRADASMDDEADAICLRPRFPYILQPSSSLQMAWKLFICCVITTVCVTHPYFLVYKKKVPVEFRFFDYMVTMLYVLDLITHLSTGENVEEGVPITFAQTSSQQMRSHWFVLDVVATLPVFEFIGDGHFAGINKLLRLPKVFRFLKSLEELIVYQSNVLRFLSYTLLMLISCYLIAALQQGIMCFQFNYCLVSNFTHSPYWAKQELDEETVDDRLMFGLYWAISMITFTSHMESWGMENWNSTLYTMAILEICIVLHISIEAVYSATIMVTTALRGDYDGCIANVKDFLIRNEVDPLLRQRFITYLQLCWYTDKAYSMANKRSSIFHDLPPHVYQDIVTRQRSKYILCIPFMKFLNKEDLKTVSTEARLFYTSPNEILLNTGDISNEMYIIRRGICEILDPETKQVVGCIRMKQHFGVFECLMRFPAYFTVRAVTHVQVFCIPKKVLSKVLELPQIKDTIQYAKELPEYGRLIRRREPFVSYEPPGPAPNTERFREPRKFETDYDFLHPFYRLGFFSIFRYIFPRFTIRPDGEYLMRYEWFRALCALLSAMVFPSYSYLQLQWPSLYLLAFLLDLSAYFDVVQRLLVGYYNAQGILVYHPVSTASHYLRGAFLVDLFACLPLENLEAPLTESFEDYFVLAHSRQVLMLNRLLQLYRLRSSMTRVDKNIKRRDLLLIIKAIPMFLVLVNVLTSTMVFSSVDIFWSISKESWLIVPLDDVGESWIEIFGDALRFNITNSPWDLHLAIYFWVVYETSTTGYGTFKPSNFDLMAVLFVGMVTGAMMTTYFSVRIISIRANVNKKLAAYQEHMKDIFVFMKREKLDQSLQKEVQEYLEHNWLKTGGVEYTSVLQLCEQITLRTDAILHMYGKTFEKCPFLKNCDLSLLRVIGREVRSAHFLTDMPLVLADDVIEDLYFVDYGIITLTDRNENSSSNVHLSRGSVFGNLDNVATVRCPTTIIANSRVHVLQISTVAFYHIISDFPQVAKKMENHRKGKENYIKGIVDTTKSSSVIMRKSVVLLRGSKGILKIIQKNNQIINLFFILISLACMYADVYNAGFQDNSVPLVAVLYVLDACFYLKILLPILLPYSVDSRHKKKVLNQAKNTYLRNEFKYDVISCLPLELISFFFNKKRDIVFSWLRLNRMFRMVTVYKCLMRHKDRNTMNLTVSMILSVFVWFTLFVHTTTCLWFFIGTMEDSILPKSSWRYKDSGESWCNNLYICSLYFIMTTFTQNGVGDIMPKHQSEVIFVSILQIISTMVYMIYVGEISNIIQFRSFRSFSFYCKYLELQEFLKNNRVSRNLVTMVNRYTLHLWRASRGMQVPHFLLTAPKCLKHQLMEAAYGHHLVQNPVFKDCEPAFLRQLVGCFQLFTYNEGMYVVKEKEITNSMYMIHTGKVEEVGSPEGNQRVYGPVECFGIEQGLNYDIPYAYSYRTLTEAQVLTLRLDDWQYLLKHFPVCKNSIYKDKKPPDSPEQPRSAPKKPVHKDGGGPSTKPDTKHNGPLSVNNLSPSTTLLTNLELQKKDTSKKQTDLLGSEDSSISNPPELKPRLKHRKKEILKPQDLQLDDRRLRLYSEDVLISRKSTNTIKIKSQSSSRSSSDTSLNDASRNTLETSIERHKPGAESKSVAKNIVSEIILYLPSKSESDEDDINAKSINIDVTETKAVSNEDKNIEDTEKPKITPSKHKGIKIVEPSEDHDNDVNHPDNKMETDQTKQQYTRVKTPSLDIEGLKDDSSLCEVSNGETPLARSDSSITSIKETSESEEQSTSNRKRKKIKRKRSSVRYSPSD